MPLAAEDWEDRVKRLPTLRDLVIHHLDISPNHQAKYNITIRKGAMLDLM